MSGLKPIKRNLNDRTPSCKKPGPLPLPIYLLQTNARETRPWIQRCRLGNYPFSQRNPWTEGSPANLQRAGNSDSKKWGTAAYNLYSFLYNRFKPPNAKNKFTIAIAQMKSKKSNRESFVAVAGNIEPAYNKDQKYGYLAGGATCLGRALGKNVP